jgi:hypothetical protein
MSTRAGVPLRVGTWLWCGGLVRLAARGMRSRADGGHLHVLQWARANGYPWDVWTCSNAAGRGHLPVLQWLRANGCPWDWRVCADAFENGHEAVLHWARANGCPEDEPDDY